MEWTWWKVYALACAAGWGLWFLGMLHCMRQLVDRVNQLCMATLRQALEERQDAAQVLQRKLAERAEGMDEEERPPPDLAALREAANSRKDLEAGQ